MALRHHLTPSRIHELHTSAFDLHKVKKTGTNNLGAHYCYLFVKSPKPAGRPVQLLKMLSIFLPLASSSTSLSSWRSFFISGSSISSTR